MTEQSHDRPKLADWQDRKVADWQEWNPGKPYPFPPALPDTTDVFIDGLSAMCHLMPLAPPDDAHWRAAGGLLLEKHMRGNLTLYGRRHYLAPLAGGGQDERVDDMAPIPRDVFAGEAEFKINDDGRLRLNEIRGRGQTLWIDYYTEIRVERAGLLTAFPPADAPVNALLNGEWFDLPVTAIAPIDAAQGGVAIGPPAVVGAPQALREDNKVALMEWTKSFLADHGRTPTEKECADFAKDKLKLGRDRVRADRRMWPAELRRPRGRPAGAGKP